MCCPTSQTTNDLSHLSQNKLQSKQYHSSTSSVMSFSSSSSSLSSLSSSVRVSFDDNTTVISTLIPSSSMSQDERQNAWYDASDLNNFKTEARSLCRQLRENANLYHVQECVRGLEQRVSLERQRNKCLTVRCILKAQLRYPGRPDQLAMIATKCTAWAQQVAQQAAQQDYQEVYHYDSDNNSSKSDKDEHDPMSSSKQQLLLLATPAQPLIAFPLGAFRFKRQCCAELEDDDMSTKSARNVRPRVQ